MSKQQTNAIDLNFIAYIDPNFNYELDAKIKWIDLIYGMYEDIGTVLKPEYDKPAQTDIVIIDDDDE